MPTPDQRSTVLIGAGGTASTPGPLRDLAASPVVAGWTAHLVDLDADDAATARRGRRSAERADGTVAA